MLIDANLLLFAVHQQSPHHERARDWLAEQMNGEQRIGIPWQSIGAFVRIATQPAVFKRPLDPAEAWQEVENWLANDLVWTPGPTPRHAKVLGDLIRRYQPRGNLVTDVQLAALAIEHGIEVCSADTDFARFTEIAWRNPLAD